MPNLKHDSKHRVTFTLNGKLETIDVEPRMLLTDALRHVLGATGTHVGCEHGVCGACTVTIDNMPARACLTLAVQIEGCEVRTVEGLAPQPDRLSVLQESFRKHHALQCGYCSAGILMSLDTLLRNNPNANEQSIREAISGHLCRCTGYAPIIAAAVDAALTLRTRANA